MTVSNISDRLLVGDKAPQSWGDFQSSAFLDLNDGSVVAFNGVPFARARGESITSLPTGAGWSPFGDVTPYHFGSGGSGWHVEINAAITYLSSIGGGRLLIENRGVAYDSRKITLRSGVELCGAGMPEIRLMAGTNDTLLESFDFVSKFTSKPGGGENNITVSGLRLNGNASQNSTPTANRGHALAIYGRGINIENVKIVNAQRCGLVTDWDATGNIYDPSDIRGWDGRVSNLSISRTGEHGWYNRISDIQADRINVTMPSRNGDNAYDGILMERAVRLTNVNVWTVINDAGGIFPRCAINVQTGGATILNAHLETAYTILDVNGQYNQIQAYLYYGMGSSHARVRDNFNQLDLCLTNTYDMTPIGVQVGEVGGWAQYNMINITGALFRDAIVNFVNSGGYNIVRGRCFGDGVGEVIMGNPNASDDIDLLGNYNSVVKQYAKSAVNASSITAGGTTQATATIAHTQQLRVLGATGDNGVILGTASMGRRYEITNPSASSVNVYPRSGETISGLSVNVPYTLAAYTSVALLATNPGVWSPL